MSERIVKIDFDQEEQEEILYCPICEKVGIRSILGAKILLPNEVKQPDYENWLQCVRCRWLCPIYQVEPEPTIQDFAQPIDNPFDNAQSQVLGTHKQGYKKTKRKSKKLEVKETFADKDTEVKEALRRGNTVNIVQDTSSTDY